MEDKYIIPETAKFDKPVLKNKLGIMDYDELRQAEASITMATISDVEKEFKQKFDEKYLKAVHKHIFKDIFDWAGEYRTVPIYKDELVIPGLSLEYAPTDKIHERIEAILTEMNNTKWDEMDVNQKSVLFTDQLTRLWRVHPFRDGNTRTTLAFGKQFAKEHDFPLDLTVFSPYLDRKMENGRLKTPSVRDLFVLSSVDEAPEPEYLQRLFRISMEKGIDQKIKKLQKNIPASQKALQEAPTDDGR